MKSAFSIGKIFGIPIKIHVSWILIFAFVVWTLMDDYYPVGLDGRPTWFYLVLSFITSFLFFGSILLHELAHSLAAKKSGVGVKSITLHIFGGVSSMDEEIPNAKKELVVSLAGPLTNIFIGVICIMVSIYFYGIKYYISDTFWWLGYVNILTAAFNLIPGFPMDGGRVLRAIIWGKTKDAEKSTRITCMVGKVCGAIIIVLGVVALFTLGISMGLWCFVIGWLFFSSAGEMQNYMKAKSNEVKYPISVYLHQNYITMMTYDKVSYVVKELQKYDQHQAILVIQDNAIVGTIDEKEIWKANQEDKNQTIDTLIHHISTARIMVEYDTNLMYAIFNQENIDDLPVIADHHLLGFISRQTVNDFYTGVKTL